MPSELLPEAVTNLLRSTRYIHLATCRDNIPHVSLMIFTYYRDEANDYILFSTPKNTTKYQNIVANPNVSMLVHDWTTSGPHEQASNDDLDTSGRRNSLYELLTNLNRNEISSVSVMINGKAQVIDESAEKFDFYRSLHANNNLEDPGAKNFVDGSDNALVVLKIDSAKVTDVDNNIQEYQGRK